MRAQRSDRFCAGIKGSSRNIDASGEDPSNMPSELTRTLFGSALCSTSRPTLCVTFGFCFNLLLR